MEGFLKSFVLQFKGFYKGLSPVKRASMMVASAIVLLSLIMSLVMISGTDYAPLLTNIPADQTATIVGQLQQKNIPFKVQDGGRTITVPKELIHSTQMALMSEMGSGKLGHVGLELFDKQDFGATSYTQRINYQRAIQGELMRAINTLDAVKKSKVMLALPAKKTFLEEGAAPTASVVVELEMGKTLNEDQIRGITFLVASAVEGLDAEKVTVVDSRGKLLSKIHNSESAANGQLVDMKTKMERDIEERVESILARVVGHGKVIARVNAQLANRQVMTTEESVDPEKTALLSVQSEQESLDGSRTNPTGVPGARANLPGAPDTGTVGFNQNVKKELKTQNFAVPKTIRSIKEAAGGLERVTVAVVVDGVTQTRTNDKGEPEEVYTPRSPEELAKFETIVKNAIGFNEARGDSVKIENIAFTKEEFVDADRILTTMHRQRIVNALFKWGILALGLALFFFIVIRPFMRWVTDSFQDSVEDMLPRTLEELESLQAENTLPGMAGALPMVDQSIDPEKAESELLKERIMALMEKDEEKAAGAISLWLVRKDI